MKTKDFHFDYPEKLVAQAPLPERDAARLLYWDGVRGLHHDRTFSELPQVLREAFPVAQFPSILLLVNDSKVFPARLRCIRNSGGRAEVFVLSTKTEEDISCLLRPQKKMKVGEVLFTEEGKKPAFEIQSIDPPRVKNVSGIPLSEFLMSHGEMPLPPYIERDPQKVTDPALHALDRMRYQTVYARDLGSAAAPTAGLHFTPAVLAECAHMVIRMAPVTLHVGLGTFQPVTAQTLDEHNMHSELCVIPQNTMDLVVEHLDAGCPVICVGTTSFRCLESVLLRVIGVELPKASNAEREPFKKRWGEIRSSIVPKLNAAAGVWHETNLFVKPQSRESFYAPLCCDGIITNFHQPESTLVMLVAALIGFEQWSELYRHAISESYRLFSYGDSSLLLFPEKK
ncbi:MAG: tRNA preQ1(34) S-adenosylmethionine ribosyltransferase-isomerase QueA [Betaproteobacteria bacterium]|nr:tRNA preQ1(34) S-adenosylmethionine ribosyltransferase-isomerase QueA [Betaproteobacteria bacterium]